MNALRGILGRIVSPIRSMFALPLRLLSAPRPKFGLSLPSRVALIVFICLLILGIVVFIRAHGIRSIAQDRPLVFAITAIVLVIAIPLFVRQAVKLWLEGPKSRFPDIDEAWQQGLNELERSGIDFLDLPLYLVHGNEDPSLIDTLFSASGQSFQVRGIPQTHSAALRWYVSRDAVFLVLMSDMSHIATLQDQPVREEAREPKESMRDMLMQTMGAMDMERMKTDQTQKLTGSGGPRRPSPSPDLVGTMVPDAQLMNRGAEAVAGPSAGAQVDNRRRAKIGPRLRHVCGLLERARQPWAPINGILSLLSLDLVSGSRAAIEDVQVSFREDLESIQGALCLRCPAIVLITGMEDELGFRELMRRVGIESAQASRFGKGVKGNQMGTPALTEHVEAVAANACASFEIYAYSLFRKESGISAYGNPILYTLICRIRTQLRKRIQDILAHAYGRDEAATGDASAQNALLLAGCYFAATGPQEDLQAFVRGVFDRMTDPAENLQDYLEWTAPAQREQSFYQGLAQAGYLLDGVLILAVVLLIIMKVLF